ncbi:MBL fold metallo-hydrolase [Desulfitobacterium chlororespirans]|uniref:Glyoxylase, beta-lactamase superfamily II n=1 Tax=Desulfitobacterium chlororespirans DSM 11544 TaxID=1121395 RepID=A0A1M7SW79_9FIRM|nr:MBL fold metallo-hydrolase [Desulfitobacterium chlororespirans]SHN62729.1 Glyoxylase, beta-lactamase superfamily II [Desulfitobacterium chlororespirans DSM 11544]
MIREIYPHIYLNEIPLPHNPLKTLNSYIVLAGDRPLILDTGFDLEACKSAFMEGVEELQIDLKKTDLVLSHMHVDHTGLADFLAEQGCQVYIGKKDGILLNNYRTSPGLIMSELNKVLNLGGEMNSTEKAIFDTTPKKPLVYTPLNEGDCLETGLYQWEVINIPGHSPGHIGLYERKHKLFFGGDHILNEITPNITFFHYKIDSLGNFIRSLEKIRRYDIEQVFPAHRSLIANHRQRIDELTAHHQERLVEIAEILGDGKKTVGQTAARMHWELRYNSWDDFPLAQKWFASGEAMAHLEHLVHKGEVRRVNHDGEAYYELVN